MRHRKSVRKLGVTRPHRRAMLSNLANSLIDQGKIKTTTARAKVLQSDVERLVTLAKKGDVHSRRQALRVLRHRTTVKKLFEEIAPEFKNMNGGFTRRAYFGRRLGDGASLSVIELNIEKKFVEEPKKKGKKKSSVEKSTAKTEDAAEKPKKKRAFRKKKKAD
jgi:large subunit ribosomal protein L17